ncbi:hypothetical protein KBX50_05125 [Micromonospora sp. C51]|uniref:hypothetical protein n=1 Tax=Micromonospora sp. C51 TaxID=2824879 RepID=UPI001B3874E7|nr:hypothetical protein [Micromonospora sp. C51]MBQ1047840.1 hypothetical protein [Micromonospora sp. C51]
MELERGEEIRVWEHPGAVRVQRWRSGHPTGSDCLHVAVGQLPDGRWFAERGTRARVYPHEQDARTVAERLKAGRGDWCEVPQIGADARPVAPGWVRRGGSWVRAAAGG